MRHRVEHDRRCQRRSERVHQVFERPRRHLAVRWLPGRGRQRRAAGERLAPGLWLRQRFAARRRRGSFPGGDRPEVPSRRSARAVRNCRTADRAVSAAANSQAFQAYTSCLRDHGVTVPTDHGRRYRQRRLASELPERSEVRFRKQDVPRTATDEQQHDHRRRRGADVNKRVLLERDPGGRPCSIGGAAFAAVRSSSSSSATTQTTATAKRAPCWRVLPRPATSKRRQACRFHSSSRARSPRSTSRPVST